MRSLINRIVNHLRNQPPPPATMPADLAEAPGDFITNSGSDSLARLPRTLR